MDRRASTARVILLARNLPVSQLRDAPPYLKRTAGLLRALLLRRRLWLLLRM